MPTKLKEWLGIYGCQQVSWRLSQFLKLAGVKEYPQERIKKISYNCLGIKAIPPHYVGTNGYVTTGTHEEINGVMVFYPEAMFRAYNNFAECFTDYINIVRNSMVKDNKGNKIRRYQKAIDNREDP